MARRKPLTLHLTKEAEGNVFLDSRVYGSTRIEGKENKFINTVFRNVRKEHPFVFWISLLGSIASIASLAIYLI